MQSCKNSYKFNYNPSNCFSSAGTAAAGQASSAAEEDKRKAGGKRKIARWRDNGKVISLAGR